MDRLDTSNTNAPHLDKVQISHFPPPSPGMNDAAHMPVGC